MQIHIKAINSKTGKLKLPKPSNALQFRRNEIARLASGRSYTITLLPKSANPWITLEVVDGKKKRNLVEIFDAASTKCQCSCADFIEDQSGTCLHIAAINNVRTNQVLFYGMDPGIRTWHTSYLHRVLLLPYNLAGYRNAKFNYFNTVTFRVESYGGNLPGAVDSVAVNTLRQIQATPLPSNVSNPESLEEVEPDSADLLNGVNLYDYQETVFTKMVKARRAICSMKMGAGKAQPLDAKILTPTGWTTMGAIQVGDMVIGSNGKPIEVLGVYPQGEKNIYEVKLSDGSSTECCEEHLWSYYGPKGQKKPRVLITKSLSEIKDKLYDNQGNSKYFLPTIESVEFTSNSTLPIHPYLLGALLGDGGMSTRCISFTTADNEMIEKIKPLLPIGISIKQKKNSLINYGISVDDLKWKNGVKPANPLTVELRKLGLMGKRSWEKHIPQQYLVATIAEREALLQGLMDTDGSTSGHTVEYTTTSLALANGVKELVLSLGGVASLNKKKTHYPYKGVIRKGRDAYRLYLRMNNAVSPFSLTRKVEKRMLKTKYLPIRSIASVEFVRKAQTQCILVDAEDHLYTTDNYILTHNTITTIACYAWMLKNEKPRVRLLVICPKSLRLQWEGEIKRVMGLDSIQVAKPEDLAKQDDIFITTYQYYTRHVDEFAKYSFDCVVADEIQFVKNADTKTWKAINKVKSDCFYGLSGTVIENRLDDLFSIMEIIDPGYLGPKWKFDDTYQNLLILTNTKILYKGVKNVKALQNELKDRVFSYDNLVLPPITYTTIDTVLSKTERASHDNYLEEAKKLIAKSLSGPVSMGDRMMIQAFLLKARQSCNGEELLTKSQNNKLSSKVQQFLKLVNDICIKQNEKLVVFSEWTQMLDICKRDLNGLVGFTTYTGKETPKQRVAAVTKFQTDPDCKIFFSSDAGGVGLDGLQLAACNIVHLELPWNPSKLDQRTGRVYRLLQTKPVSCWYLVSDGGIEVQIAGLLTSKREIRELTLKELV